MSRRSGAGLKRRARCALSFVALGIFLPMAGTAQAPELIEGRPRAYVGLAAAIAQPTDEFADYVSVGGGLHGFLRVGLDARSIAAIRLGGGFITYGNETERVCLSTTVGCRIQVDLTTSNNIFLLGLGPELTLPLGPVRIYGNGSVGFSYFSTESQVEGSSQEEPFASTENYGDGGFAWSAGGGIEVQVAVANGTPIAIDLGLGYQKNGLREYLTEGGIVDNPDGSITLDVKRSQANFLLWRLGVSIGLRSTEDGEDP
jgi:hypothetical protein